jgi:hypothetical protein
MKRIILLTLILAATAAAQANDVIVTRLFTGLWTQPAHENQGINLQIVEQSVGKVAVAYWYTYGEDNQSAWYIGIGEVVENRAEMILYEVTDVGFLAPNDPMTDPVSEVGTLDIEFSSCDEGEVTFDTTLPGIGSGSFDIERLTSIHNTECTGGVSDDTPSDVLLTEQRIGLSPARDGVTGSGHADFEERADRTEFSVEVEDLPDGSYRIVVGGVDRGELVVSLGVGETEFRSPVETGKVLLTFDPREQLIEVHDGAGAVLTSGDGVIDGGDDNGGDGGDGGDPDIDFGSVEIEVELTNSGVYPAGSGDAKLEPREDRTDFSVEIEDVPEGNYPLRIGGDVVGSIQVTTLADGSVEGELEFRNPVEPGKILLDFDPRGKLIEVLEGSTVIFEADFPAQ